MPKTRARADLFAAITDGLTDVAQEDVVQVPLASLVPGRSQPRKFFGSEGLDALAASIRQQGVLQPLLVRSRGGDYEIIAGERRFRAARLAGLETVPALVREIADQDVVELALIENLQREDLNPVEETEALLGLYALRTGAAPAQAAAALQQLYFVVAKNEEAEDVSEIEKFFTEYGGMNWKSFVNHRLPLLKLPDDVLGALREGKVEYTKAREIARLKDPGARASLVDQVVAEGLSLQALKQRLKTLKPTQSQPEPTLVSRVANLRTLVRKTRALEAPAKRRRVEVLLGKLEAILSEEE